MRFVKTREKVRLYELEEKEQHDSVCFCCDDPPVYRLTGPAGYTMLCKKHIPKGWKVD